MVNSRINITIINLVFISIKINVLFTFKTTIIRPNTFYNKIALYLAVKKKK